MSQPARPSEAPVDRPRPRRTTLLALGSLVLGTAALLRAATAIEVDYRYRDFDLHDALFYERVATRVEAGEDYYGAANRELHARGYETRSTFNWRTPLYAHVLGKFRGSGARQAALAGLSLLTALLVARMVAADLGRTWGAVAGLAVFAASAWWLRPEPPWFTEAWAGQLILLALAARALGWPWVGLVAGASALFLRELALPFVFLCLGDAWRRRRWGEAMGWSTCLALYGLHFLMHESRVAFQQFPERFHPPTDRANWVEWGGLSFLLATTRMNYLLSYLPFWCAALYLPLATFGLVALAARDRAGRFLLVGFPGYLVAFLAVGKEFNYYWGWITAPTLALGFAVAPASLLGSATRSRDRPGAARDAAGRPDRA